MRKTTAFSLTILALVLTACGDVRENLGIKKKAPDEFAVIKRAPLELPPDYTLRPPNPGAPRPQEQTTVEEARQAIFGGDGEEQPSEGDTAVIKAATSSQPAVQTDGEALLLQKAGGDQIAPNIRQAVDSETAKLHDRNKPVAEKLLGIGGDRDEPSATVVDAAAEAERLRKNEEAGLPATEGETPVIEE